MVLCILVVKLLVLFKETHYFSKLENEAFLFLITCALPVRFDFLGFSSGSDSFSVQCKFSCYVTFISGL